MSNDSNRRLYSEVLSGSSGRESSGDEFAEGHSLPPRPRSSLCNWLSAYQNEREEVALAKALEQSKVNLFRKKFSKVIVLVLPKYETKFLFY